MVFFFSFFKNEKEKRKSSKLGWIFRIGKIVTMRHFILVGLPGCGKSTLAVLLAEKYNATIISQDDFIDKGQFFWAIKATPGSLIVDRCNHTERHRSDVYNTLVSRSESFKPKVDLFAHFRVLDPGEEETPEVKTPPGVYDEIDQKITFVVFRHPSDPVTLVNKQAEVCIVRIHKRGDNHKTLKVGYANVTKVVEMFKRDFKCLLPLERQKYTFIEVGMDKSPQINVAKIVAKVGC